MSDDRFKDAGQFQPEKAWRRIRHENLDRKLEAEFPKKWWHDIVFGWGGLIVLLGTLASIGLLIYSLFGVLRK